VSLLLIGSQMLNAHTYSIQRFWLIIAISLGMLVVQVLFHELINLRKKIGSDSNWDMWVQTLAQTMLGLETIVSLRLCNVLISWPLQ